jgi:hypothetical protein
MRIGYTPDVFCGQPATHFYIHCISDIMRLSTRRCNKHVVRGNHQWEKVTLEELIVWEVMTS